MMYDNNEMESNGQRRGINWVAVGILIGVIGFVSFTGGRIYEAYKIADNLKQAAQKFDELFSALNEPIPLFRSDEGTSPAVETTAVPVVACALDTDVIKQYADPSVTNLIADTGINVGDELVTTAAYETVEVDVRLRDLNSDDLAWLDDGDVAEVSSDQDILVWVNLPDGIDELDALYESNYPAEIKAGEAGTIEVTVTCYDNHTKYVGSLTVLATDDLSLALSDRHTKWIHSSKLYVAHKYFPLVEDEYRRHTAISYSLYTSYEDGDKLYDGWGRQTSFGYEISYRINAE